MSLISDGVEEDVGANNIKLMMDVFVNQLPTCVNREMIDKVSERNSLLHEISITFSAGCTRFRNQFE